MKKHLISLIITGIAVLSISSAAFACTNITIKAKDNSIMVGRTLEFGADLQSDIITSPKGRSFATKTTDGKIGLSWKSKYGYLLIDYFKTGHPVDGINQQGLSFGFLYMPDYTQYPVLTPENTSKSLPIYHLGDWILGNFATIDEVKIALHDVVIYNKPETVMGHDNVTFPLHAIVNDAKGNSIVIEFAKGETKVYDNPLGVLTNAPSFPWQINNLKNYVNLSPYSPAPIVVDGYTYAATGQGSGMTGLPGDTTPPSRFVKVSLLSQVAKPVDTSKEALTLAQHILNTVDIPAGFVRGEKNNSSPLETTQWTVYKDLTHQILYFTSYHNSNLQSVDINKLDLSENAKPVRMPIASKQVIKDVSGGLK